jgi:hypothetical protein
MAGTTIAGKAGGLKVISFQQINGPAAATLLTVPAKAKAALISADTQPVRLRFDGTDPTTAIGHLIANGDHLFVSGDIKNIKVIQTTATALVNVTYFG